MTRKELKTAYKDLVATVSAILFRYDPADLNYGFNPDEYESEAETIVARLGDCRSEDEVVRLVESELEQWFDEETAAAATIPAIAHELWGLVAENRELWQ